MLSNQLVSFCVFQVHIDVINTNDNAPLFTSTEYTGSYPESSTVGTTLLRVKATDADYDRLIYTLPTCCNSANTRSLFKVGAESGK